MLIQLTVDMEFISYLLNISVYFFQHRLSILTLSGYISVFIDLFILILQYKFVDKNISSSRIYIKA